MPLSGQSANHLPHWDGSLIDLSIHHAIEGLVVKVTSKCFFLGAAQLIGMGQCLGQALGKIRIVRHDVVL
jgi:hypothetical protein